jgi:hypothetical protein
MTNENITLADLYLNQKIKIDKRSGFDDRYNRTLSEQERQSETELMSIIKLQFKKMEMLKFLENPHHSQEKKLILIDQMDEKPGMVPNITMGGLYKDWYFDL